MGPRIGGCSMHRSVEASVVTRRTALRWVLGALVGSAGASLLAACAPASPPSGSGSGTASTAPTPAATPAQANPAPTTAPPTVAGTARPATVAEVALYSASDRQAILEEGARKEGQLFWYTTNVVDQIARPLQEGFQKKYPFVKFDLFRANGTDLEQRIRTEYGAGRYDVDVVNALDAVASLKASGHLQAFYSPELSNHPPEYVDPDKYWGGNYTTFQVLGYNTQLVRDTDVPSSYESLLDPKWKGKLIWSTSPSTGGPMFVGNTLRVMGQQQGMDYLKKLAQVGVANTDASTRAVLDQVISGDFAVNVVTSLHHAFISRSQGAPVTWSEPAPIYGIFDQAGLPKNAPHPHAALLFLDYMFSAAGQQVYVNAYYSPNRSGVAPKDPALQPPTRGVKVNLVNGEVLLQNGKEWTKIYRDLFLS